MFYRPLRKSNKLRIDGKTLSEVTAWYKPQKVAQSYDMNAPGMRAKYNYETLVGVRRASGARNLAKLSPAHRAVVAGHIQGMSNVEIAAVLDRSAVWVGEVLHDPLVKDLIGKFMSGVEGELEALFPAAVGAIRTALDDENPLTALKAVDRFVSMSQRYQKKEGSASAEDVIKKALELASESVRTVNAVSAGRALVIDQRPGGSTLALLPSPTEEDQIDANSSTADRN